MRRRGRKVRERERKGESRSEGEMRDTIDEREADGSRMSADGSQVAGTTTHLDEA